jgi:hypothetical protein
MRMCAPALAAHLIPNHVLIESTWGEKGFLYFVLPNYERMK